MRVAHLSTVDTHGGAARSAYRLHRGLLAAGIESSMVVKQKFSDDDSVVLAPLEQSGETEETMRLWNSAQDSHIHQQRTKISNTYFSLPAPGYDLSRHPIVARADLIHLHWVSQLVSPLTVAALHGLGKPLVWTLHDQRPFTGGCHFSAGCSRFETDCARCPQLASDSFGFTSASLADSIELFGARNITVVSPSQWLAACARRSALFGESRVEAIPYGLETEVFRPRDKAAARTAWKLSPDAICFLFGAFDWTEKRKGFEVLANALKINLRDASFRQRVQDGSVAFLCFGKTSPGIEALHLPVKFLGQINSDEEMAMAYSTADAVLLPSLDDNLPNVMLEAMCCGTPVIAHRVGGVPDVVRDGENGMLVPLGDARQFAEAIRTLTGDAPRLAEFRENCRREIPQRFTLALQAERYAKLYRELLAKAKPSAVAAPEFSGIPCPLQEGGPRLMAIFPELSRPVRRERRWSFFKWLRRNIPLLVGTSS